MPIGRGLLIALGAVSASVPATIQAQDREPTSGLLGGSDATASSIEESVSSGPTGPEAYRHTILGAGTFDDQDFFLGAAYRFTVNPRLDLGLQLFGSFRTNNRHTVEQIREHFFIQREEKNRRLLGCTVDKVQMVTDVFGVYLGVGSAYSTADYVGTEAETEAGWDLLVDAGLTVRYLPQKVRGTIRVGFQRAGRYTSENRMAYLAAGIEL